MCEQGAGCANSEHDSNACKLNRTPYLRQHSPARVRADGVRHPNTLSGCDLHIYKAFDVRALRWFTDLT